MLCIEESGGKTVEGRGGGGGEGGGGEGGGRGFEVEKAVDAGERSTASEAVLIEGDGTP